MALTELKSDLSKFRRPIQKPIVETQSTKINYDNDKTPLSGLLAGLSSPSKIEKTAEKVGITPTYKREEKFVGETTPNNFDFSPQFTTPQLSSVDFFPNTSADGFTTKMRETRFNLSGLTSPKPLTLEAKFLGETDPNRLSLEGKFLGETTPNQLGDTPDKPAITPTLLGDTPDKPATTPNPLGATPNKPATTPNPLGATPNKPATTPQIFNFTPQFTTPTISITDYFPNTDAKGFTPKIKNTQFVDINNGIFTQRIPNSKLGEVNFFPNDDATGFTKNFVDKNETKFTGINGNKFTSPKVNFNGDYGLSFSPGNKIKLEGSALANYQNGNQKWVYGKKYEEGYVSIGDLLLRENSPSYIDKIYSQFNLRDDSYNPYPPIFHQPFVLRGIQRKGKKEPQKWGFGVPESLVTGGIDLIRGGVVSSTERALIDVYRIGRFILSPKGLVWSVLQFGMQRTNAYNKLWTPINLLAAVGGQHIGFKPQRHGLLPIETSLDTDTYQNILTGGYKTKLEDFRKDSDVLKRLGNNLNKVPLRSQNGGPESVYGIGISTTNTSTNTFSNPGQDYGNKEAKYNQKFNPIFETTELSLPNIDGLTSVTLKTPRNPNEDFKNTYEKSFIDLSPTTKDESFGPLANKQYDEGKTPATGYEKLFEGDNFASKKLKTRVVASDEVLNYDDIRNFANAKTDYKTSFNDFRTKKSNTYKENLKAKITDYNDDYYTNKNIENKMGLGKSDTSIGISTTGDGNLDLIKLSFTTSGTTIQFRGTVNSISETFSPNWTEIKYSGRAENAYIYDTFSRELTFGFRVFAYSVGELKPMWQKLDQLGRMTMPTYLMGDAGNGYRGNITNFTLGTMYKKFPALITNLTYTVPDDFTWEIGLNSGSAGNELPMGVDITITLKLLGKELHSTSNSPIYDYK